MQHRELEIALKGHNVMLTGFPTQETIYNIYCQIAK